MSLIQTFPRGKGGDVPEAMSQTDVAEIINGLVIDPLDMPEAMTQSDVEEVKDAFSLNGYNPFTVGVGGGYAPIGTIIQYMGVTAPQDYLICDGTVYNIADYPQLAEFFAAQFGAANHFGGDGTTTFAVPDLRGEFLRGTGTNSHENQGSGANVGVHQDATEHLDIYTWDNNVGILANNAQGNQAQKIDYSLGATKDYYIQTTQTGTVTRPQRGSYTSRPTNTSVLYCIKAIVAGEVYSTEERVVGTWIDGKKIYRKTIDIGSLPNSTTKQIDLSSLDINHIISTSGTSYNDNFVYSFPRISTTNGFVEMWYVRTTKILEIRTAKDLASYSHNYIVLEYTKTTN